MVDLLMESQGTARGFFVKRNLPEVLSVSELALDKKSQPSKKAFQQIYSLPFLILPFF
jgi:hypothetical protein